MGIGCHNICNKLILSYLVWLSNIFQYIVCRASNVDPSNSHAAAVAAGQTSGKPHTSQVAASARAPAKTHVEPQGTGFGNSAS